MQPPPDIGLQATQPGGFGLFPVRSPLLGESRLISFPWVTKMFQFAQFPLGGVLPPPSARRLSLRAGCPIRRSPDHRLPAAPRGLSQRGHVLHRPDAPRHSPCAHFVISPCVRHRSFTREPGVVQARRKRTPAIVLQLVRCARLIDDGAGNGTGERKVAIGAVSVGDWCFDQAGSTNGVALPVSPSKK